MRYRDDMADCVDENQWQVPFDTEVCGKAPMASMT